MAMEQRMKFAAIWHWLRDAENRKVVAWLGSGLIVLLGALLYQNTGQSPGPAEPSTKATTNTGIASGGDVTVGGDVTIDGGPEEDAESPQR